MEITLKLRAGIKREMVIGKPITVKFNDFDLPIGRVTDYDEETNIALIIIDKTMLNAKWIPADGINISALSKSFQASLDSIELHEEERMKNKKEKMRKK